MKISIEEARRLVAEGQCLADKQKNSIGSVVSALGGIQYDPNPILQLNHYLALWSRIPDFRPAYFDAYAYEQGNLVETSLYKRNLFIVPVHDINVYYAATRKIVRWGTSREQVEAELNQEELAECAEQIKQAFRERGACLREELWEFMGLASAWKEYRDGRKQGLLINCLPMFQTFFRMKDLNEILVCQRLPGTFRQPLYTLRELLLKDKVAPPAPSDSEAVKSVVLRLIHSFGVTHETHIKAITGCEREDIAIAFRSLRDEEQIANISVDGIKKEFFTTSAHIRNISGGNGKLDGSITLLSPMEGMIRDKNWLKTLYGYSFNFEYFKKKGMKWPLSILAGHEMLGFLDCKMDRKQRALHVKEMCIMEGKTVPEERLRETIHSLARFHEAKTLYMMDNKDDGYDIDQFDNDLP